MQVIEVIPLKKGVNIESLSYYSSQNYEVGALIEIPVRNKKIIGVVVAIKPVSAAKTALRTATFSLRKLEPQPETGSLPESIITTAQTICKRVPAQVGAVLFSMLPPDIRAGARPYPQLPDHIMGDVVPPTVLTSTSEDRYIAYRSHIRQAFAHRGSVLFVVPTGAAVEQAAAKLSKGIEKRVITFASTHTKRQLDSSYKNFEDLSQSKLIITTPNFAFLCRHDVTTIIIEQSGSPHYVARSRPYLDARQTLKTYARTIGAELILGDNLPLTEDEILRREDFYTTYEEHVSRLHLGSSVVVAEQSKEPRGFRIITPELAEHINRTVENRGHVFLYASRRGLAPLVLCRDCGYIFRCPDSGAPFSLLRTGHGEEEKRWFYCGTSGVRTQASDTCPECGSWRLVEQGIGIQQVHDYVKKHFAFADITLIDHTTATTHTKVKKLVNKFYEEQRSVLISTNLALPYLSKPIDCTGIISYEAMRAVPTWRADETVFQTLLNLREITSKDLVVQTRNEPDELLNLASKGLVDKFYDGEIEIRRSLGYPPFSVFILLTFMGNRTQVKDIEEQVAGALQSYKPTFYNGPLSNPEKTIRYGLLRIPATNFPDKHLLSILTALPPYIKVEINPAKII